MASRPVLWLALAAGIAASVLGSLAWRDSVRAQSGERLAQASGDLSERLAEDVREHDQLLLGARRAEGVDEEGHTDRQLDLGHGVRPAPGAGPGAAAARAAGTSSWSRSAHSDRTRSMP